MLENLPFDSLARRLGDALPSGMDSFRSDLEKTFRAILQGSFEKMNLVSREEFEVQRMVLAKTREKLERLEIRVAELENRLPKS